MDIRKLEMKDLKYMYEWMQDDEIIKHMYTDFKSKTIEDLKYFIENSFNDNNIHFAIVSDLDEYMGTVSLKNINNNTAELGIVVRKVAMSKGYAWYGIESIINYAFDVLNLESIYWCVNIKNIRAIRFYDKHNFHKIVDVPSNILKRYNNNSELIWYSVLKGDSFNIRDNVVGCKVIHINTIPTINAGELSYFESSKNIDFDIKRIYYISKVPEGIRRGFHAHKKLKQLLFCPYGKIQLLLENEYGREEIELSDPSIGIIIDRPTWREMIWLKKDSVLCVAASDYYDENDYIRDYEYFKKSIC